MPHDKLDHEIRPQERDEETKSERNKKESSEFHSILNRFYNTYFLDGETLLVDYLYDESTENSLSHICLRFSVEMLGPGDHTWENTQERKTDRGTE